MRYAENSDEHTDWRDVPLLTAISLGVMSVEADVNLINGTLFVSPWYHRNPHC